MFFFLCFLQLLYKNMFQEKKEKTMLRRFSEKYVVSLKWDLLPDQVKEFALTLHGEKKQQKTKSSGIKEVDPLAIPPHNQTKIHLSCTDGKTPSCSHETSTTCKA